MPLMNRINLMSNKNCVQFKGLNDYTAMTLCLFRDRETDRQTNGQTGKQTDRQRGDGAERRTSSQTKKAEKKGLETKDKQERKGR